MVAIAMHAQILHLDIFALQVCVLKEWADEEVMEWLKTKVDGIWQIRNEEPIKITCEANSDFNHIVYDFVGIE